MVNGQHPRAGSPLVSVIVPTYNYGHLLPETIHCLQAQSLTDWECIIVDDGSTDETRAAAAKLEEADHRVSYLQRNHQGVSPARNVGLQAASGKYIQLLDADDLIEASKLKEQVSWLEEHPATDLVYGSARFFNHDHPDERRFRVFGEDQPWIPELSGGRNKLLPALIRENIMPINCPLFRASILEHIGLFDESLSTMEDWDFWLRCALGDKRFQFHDGQATLALVRYHPTSASTNYRRMMDGYIRVRTKLLPLVSEPYLAEFNRSKLDYLAECLTRIDALLDDLTRLLPADARFILADDG
ncbi:MAG TPA: glycosyltransferase family A protein, partial [Chthoniobacteraceae bacterium]